MIIFENYCINPRYIISAGCYQNDQETYDLILTFITGGASGYGFSSHFGNVANLTDGTITQTFRVNNYQHGCELVKEISAQIPNF